MPVLVERTTVWPRGEECRGDDAARQPYTLYFTELITLPGTVTAIAFDFGDFPGDVATITLSDGTVQTETAGANGTVAFVGVTDPEGITSVDITEPADSFTINVTDFSYATANSPEPMSILLFCSGLLGVTIASRTRLKA